MRLGILLLSGVVVGFIHGKPLASDFLNVEKAEWSSLPHFENISVFEIAVDKKRILAMASQLNVFLIYTERNMMIEARTKSKTTDRSPTGAFREGEIVRQLSVNTRLDTPISLSDSVVSRRSSGIAECDVKRIVNHPSTALRGIVPRFFARESHVGRLYISSQFLVGHFSGVPVRFFGSFRTFLGGLSSISSYFCLGSYGPPLETGEKRVDRSNGKQGPVYPPRLLIGTGFLVVGALLIGYGTKGFNERLFKLGWNYALSLVFGPGWSSSFDPLALVDSRLPVVRLPRSGRIDTQLLEATTRTLRASSLAAGTGVFFKWPGALVARPGGPPNDFLTNRGQVCYTKYGMSRHG